MKKDPRGARDVPGAPWDPGDPLGTRLGPPGTTLGRPGALGPPSTPLGTPGNIPETPQGRSWDPPGTPLGLGPLGTPVDPYGPQKQPYLNK